MIPNIPDSELSHLYKAVVETTSQGICLITLDRNIAYINEAFSLMIGRSREDVVGKPLIELLSPPSSLIFTAKQKERLQGRLKDHYELCFVHGKSGEWVYTTTNVSPIFGADGRQVFSLGMLTDITEMKRIKTELDRNIARLESAQRMAHLGFWELDFRSGNIWWSKEMMQIYGIDTPTSIEQVDQLIHPEDLEKVHKARAQGRLSGKSFKMQFRILNPNGKIRHILNTTEIELNKSGTPLRFMGTSLDITEQIEKDNLVQSQRAQMVATSKMSILGEMAAGIAHEINTPLAIVLLNAESLENELKNIVSSESVAHKRLAKIISVTDRIAKIVSGLRAFSRSADKDPFICESMHKIVEETLQLCHEKFKQGGVEVQVHEEDEYLSLECRPTQISQVILNLLNNSFDAVSRLPKKWIRMDIRKAAGCVEISITDSGGGIPGEMTEKIFNPFFTTKEIGQGTGLGLSTSKGLVEDHHGRIWVDSQNLQTCFIIQLPLKQKVAPRLTSAAPAPL